MLDGIDDEAATIKAFAPVSRAHSHEDRRISHLESPYPVHTDNASQTEARFGFLKGSLGFALSQFAAGFVEK